MAERFPGACVARLDRDTARGRHQSERILAEFRDAKYDILVGTQMIAKGHDIHRVTLVGVISADVALGLPDFRAAERTFQLLTQVAGRAGRGELPGAVIIQTYFPEHYAIRCAAAQDYSAFYPERAAVPARDALPAVRGASQHPDPQFEAGAGSEVEWRAGPAPGGWPVGRGGARWARRRHRWRG